MIMKNERPYAWYQTQEYYIEVDQLSIQQPQKKIKGEKYVT